MVFSWSPWYTSEPDNGFSKASRYGTFSVVFLVEFYSKIWVHGVRYIGKKEIIIRNMGIYSAH